MPAIKKSKTINIYKANVISNHKKAKPHSHIFTLQNRKEKHNSNKLFNF